MVAPAGPGGATENLRRVEAAGVADRVHPIFVEAHQLPFGHGFFDVVVALDSYHYFGTDDCYIGYITRFLKPDGRLAIVVPGGERELEDAPELWKVINWDMWSFHRPDWWRAHWQRSGLVEVEHADLVPDGWRHWLASERATGFLETMPAWAAALEADAGRTFGFSRVVARKLARDQVWRPVAMTIEYRRNHTIGTDEHNQLRLCAWGRENAIDWQPVLAHSLGWVTAHSEGRLIGFVNVAWDGGGHMFLLDTTVDPDYQRQGIGSELVRKAIALSAEAGGDWLHVDSDEVLMNGFYGPCGFEPTPAGLVNLDAVRNGTRPKKRGSTEAG